MAASVQIENIVARYASENAQLTRRAIFAEAKNEAYEVEINNLESQVQNKDYEIATLRAELESGSGTQTKARRSRAKSAKAEEPEEG